MADEFEEEMRTRLNDSELVKLVANFKALISDRKDKEARQLYDAAGAKGQDVLSAEVPGYVRLVRRVRLNL